MEICLGDRGDLLWRSRRFALETTEIFVGCHGGFAFFGDDEDFLRFSFESRKFSSVITDFSFFGSHGDLLWRPRRFSMEILRTFATEITEVYFESHRGFAFGHQGGRLWILRRCFVEVTEILLRRSRRLF